jgi:hypothetical protein
MNKQEEGTMTTTRMKYGAYKKHYADCETVPETYDRGTKTIEVIIPDGRMKPSGTRGERFRYFWFEGIEGTTGQKKRICIKAITKENARKRLPTDIAWDDEGEIKITRRTTT